jgi:hypothetical protein
MAEILPLGGRRRRLRVEQARRLRQLVLEFEGLDLEAAGRLVAAIDREVRPEGEWRFVLLDAERNGFVVAELLERSLRPQTAMKLWAKLPLYLHRETNEILATRDQLAREIGAHANHVTNILTELAAMGAVTRERAGRRVVLTLNPRIATHTTGLTRASLQERAPELRPLPSRHSRGKPMPRPVLRVVEPAG